MLEATRLLLYTDEPAASIAYRLGYRDPAYFGRCFRRATGLSPRRFRLERLPTAARAPSSSRGTPRR
ncbi:MAG: helix-turn-helix domain-containing protein [Acidobacteria bacterium]|nr:helix-turn-helix domain-containing protein [Acidobacteriota bacterium]